MQPSNIYLHGSILFIICTAQSIKGHNISTVCYSYPNQNLIMIMCLIGWDTKLFTLPNLQSSLYFKMSIKNTCGFLGIMYNAGLDHQLHPPKMPHFRELSVINHRQNYLKFVYFCCHPFQAI